MADEIIDFSGLTLAIDEAQSISECVFEEVFQSIALTEVHEVFTGVQRDKRIPIFGKLSLVGKLSEGCDQTSTGAKIETSEKTWTPKEIAIRLIHCKTDIPALFKAFKRKQRASDYNMDGTEEMGFLTSRLLTALEESIWRIAWFSDTDADEFSNGGVITDGTDLGFFNMLDGLWKQIFTGVAGLTIKKVTISENSEASYVAQDALDIDTAYNTLKAMYNKADSRLRSNKNAIFVLTDSLVSNWEDFLEHKSLNFSLQEVKDGITKFTYRGKKIIRLSIWDELIREFEDNGTTWNLPHRAVFTVPSNIPIGTLSEEDLKEVISIYDPVSKKNYLDADYTEDAKVLEEYKIVVAY